ncbi:MAG: hypothetical protein KDA81_21145, partial [Planctomycetaceae bacterium]|nr:hypothetical protein [Planctomycetaceae bacterium]
MPTTSLRGQIVQTNRLEHSVLVTDSDTPSRRAKPPDVIGCEAMLLIRDMPSFDPANYSMIGVWTRFPEVVRFNAEDTGKIAHYLFRWLNTKGERG